MLQRKLSCNTRKETKHSCIHFQTSRPCSSSNLHIHTVSPHTFSPSHPELPLSPPSPPFLFLSLRLTLFVPLLPFSLPPQMSAHQLRSDGWEEKTGWIFIERAHTHAKQTRTECHTVTCCSRDPGLGSPSLKIFCLFFIFPHLFHRLWPHQYETDAPNSLVTADKHGVWSEKVRNLAVSLL